MRHPVSSRPLSLLAGLAWLVAAVPAAAQGGPLMAPVNPQFLAWQQARSRPVDWFAAALNNGDAAANSYGFRPAPVDLSHIKGPVFAPAPASMMAGAALPATYDMRALGQVTPVRNQNPYGCCWAFAAMSSIESSLLKAGKGASDLSEWHLGWFAFNNFNATLVGYDKASVPAGDDSTFDQGGNDYMTTAILARGTGAVAESASPYQNLKPYPPGTLPKGTEANVIDLRETLFLGNGFSASDAKAAITSYGGVAVGLDFNTSDYSTINHTYRIVSTTTPNHEVTLVGWDDTYSATRFPAGNRPAVDGAWIARNNWSTAWGEAGYFYIAYDSHFDSGTVYLADTPRNQRIYQYDPLGWVSNIGYSSPTAWCANVFTAVANEKITEVTFYASAANTSYQIYVNTGVTGGPSTGTQVLGPQAGTLDAPGYRRVQLNTPVQVSAGSRFSITVQLTTPGYNYPIPLQIPDATNLTSKATASTGQGYMSPNGVSWTDAAVYKANTSVCIKAFSSSSASAKVRNDFNGDGKADLLWRNAATGEVYLMPMNGAAPQPGAVFYNEARPAWQIVGTGDFDGDGKADLLWWNSSTGQVYQMLMNGSTIKAQAQIYAEPDTAWKIVGTGDFDGDGMADILWRNSSTGAVYLMPMNGATVLPGTVIYTEPNPAWQIVAIADFDGDGKADILWWNSSTGQVYQMLMNGSTIKAQAQIYAEPNTAWKIVGSGDFDGDGKADLLWRNSSTGAVYLMPMNGATVLPGTVIYSEPNPAWQIVSIADFDGDGKADILWWNSATGQVYQMLMNGATIKAQNMIYAEPNTAWTIQAGK